MIRYLGISKIQIWQHSDVIELYRLYREWYIIRKDVYIVLLVQDKNRLNLEESIYTNNNVS